MDKPIGKLKLLTTKGEVVDAILYCHQEQTIIGSITCYTLRLNTPADASGTTLQASTGSVARVVWGRFVYRLTGIAKILASTIYATYRAYTGGGTVNAEIDILIRKADGTVRTTIATGVSKSANLGTSWATYTGANYSFAEYTVVDQTDYLEIDYVANVTAKKSGQYAYLRIDDNTLALADQTRSQEWSLAGVATLDATDITENSATLNGRIYGTETMTVRGFEWGKQSGNYTDSWTEEGSFPPGSSYSKTITNLDRATLYYYRAKAYSPQTGWLYGPEKSFSTLGGVTLWLTATEVGSNSELQYKLGLEPSTEEGGSGDFFVSLPTLIGIRVWKRSASGEETEITGGTPVAQADITGLIDGQINVRTGTWTINSAIPLNPTDKLVVRVYIYRTTWVQLLDSSYTYYLVWVSDALNATQINPSTITVYYYIYYDSGLDIEWFCFGNGRSRLTNVSLTLPTVTYTLTLNVDKTSGYVGDVFTFTGTLTQNGTPISGATVTLYKDNVALSPSTTTNEYGNYAFQWVADTPGNHSFYAEAVW